MRGMVFLLQKNYGSIARPDPFLTSEPHPVTSRPLRRLPPPVPKLLEQETDGLGLRCARVRRFLFRRRCSIGQWILNTSRALRSHVGLLDPYHTPIFIQSPIQFCFRKRHPHSESLCV